MINSRPHQQLDPITLESIIHYITTTFAAVQAVENWGDLFFYYNPDDKLPNEIYFATLKSQDDAYDRASNLDRPSIFRLNIGLSKTIYRSLFGAPPSHLGSGEVDASGRDYTVLDQLLPHPVYAQSAWVCVLNPSSETFETVRPLLEEAYKAAVNKYNKRLPANKS